MNNSVLKVHVWRIFWMRQRRWSIPHFRVVFTPHLSFPLIKVKVDTMMYYDIFYLLIYYLRSNNFFLYSFSISDFHSNPSLDWVNYAIIKVHDEPNEVSWRWNSTEVEEVKSRSNFVLLFHKTLKLKQRRPLIFFQLAVFVGKIFCPIVKSVTATDGPLLETGEDSTVPQWKSGRSTRIT